MSLPYPGAGDITLPATSRRRAPAGYPPRRSPPSQGLWSRPGCVAPGPPPAPPRRPARCRTPNRVSVRGQPLGYGEQHGRAVAQGVLVEYGPGPESRLADHLGPPVVPQGAGHDLGARRGPLVYQDYQGGVQGLVALGDGRLLLASGIPSDIDRAAGREKLRGRLLGLLHQSPRVAPEVEYEA